MAGRYADMFQFIGMTPTGTGGLGPTGFAIEDLEQRRSWLEDAAGDRFQAIELSALVQRTVVGDGEKDTRADLLERFGFGPDLIEDCPFLLIGSSEEIIDKVERLRDRLGISHYVVRDAEAFAPVVDALAGR